MTIGTDTKFRALLMVALLQGLFCFQELEGGRKLLQADLPICDQVPCLSSQLPSSPLEKKSIFQFTEDAANLKILQQIISSDVLSSELKQNLQDAEFVTVFFAPSDDAFNKYFQESGITQAELLADGDLLNEIIKLHIVQNTSFVKGLFDGGNEIVVSTLLDSVQLVLKKQGQSDVVEIKSPGNIDVVLSPAKMQLNDTVIHSADSTQVFILTEVLLPKPAEISVCDQVPCTSDKLGSTVLEIQSLYQFVQLFPNLQIATRIVESPALNRDVAAAFKRSDFLAIVMLPTDRWFEQYFQRIGVTEEAFLENADLINSFVAIHIIPSVGITYPEADQISSSRALQEGVTMYFRVGPDANLQVSLLPDFPTFANVAAEINFRTLSKTDSLQVWIVDKVLELYDTFGDPIIANTPQLP
eukprot:TRINITY_DN7250_c0_g1_i2.p1 TRINITY_DN7250_c0_g1~~TRINITY_DN7250_c0_g1_i2.p1  ORF type:complete len:414 (-),score=54.18 TRINITY_DN7250_c0_g1_i2:763-2004(-)